MVFELKHGNINCKVQVCNMARELAIIEIEKQTGLQFSDLAGSDRAMAVWFGMYLFQSYKTYQNKNGLTLDLSKDDFMEMYLDEKATNSNIAEIVAEMQRDLAPEKIEGPEVKAPETDSKKKEASVS